MILKWYVAGPNVRYKCDGTGVRARANQMVLWVAIRRRKCSSVGAFNNRVKSLRWLRWFQSVVVRTKKGSCVVQYLSEGLRKDWVILNLVSNLESWTLGSSKATAPFQLTTTPEQRRRSQPKKTDALWGRTKRQLPFSWPLPEGDEDGGRRRRQTHSGVEQSGSSLSADRYPRVTKTEADEEDRRTLGSNKAAAPFQLTATRGWRRRKQTKKTDALWGRTKRQLPFSWPLPQGDEDGGRRRRETHSGVTLGSNSDALWVEQNGSSLSADD